MATIPAANKLGRKPRCTARTTADKKGQKTSSTIEFAANGFLRHQFLPLYQAGTDMPEKENAARGFFKSVSYLSKDLEVTAPHTNKAFPYNILLAFWQMRQQYSIANGEQLLIMENDAGNISLATKHIYDTGMTFYFIPIVPLFRLFQNKRNRQAGQLLMSVCSYLYHIAGVPYYRNSDTALFYYYETIRDWVKDDLESFDTDELNGNLSQLNRADYFGDVIHRRIFNRLQLEQFAQRLNAFKSKNEFDEQCLKVAKSFYDLWQQYPTNSIFDHINGVDAAEFQDECVRAEQYISFVADNEGWLYEQLSDMLNNEFNECGYMEEPTLMEIHDGSEHDEMNLEFEKEIFSLIADLCTLINDIP